MIFFHTRGEGQFIHQGFNFWPRSEWAYSRGFIFRLGDWLWWVRYSPKTKKLWCYTRHHNR